MGWREDAERWQAPREEAVHEPCGGLVMRAMTRAAVELLAEKHAALCR